MNDPALLTIVDDCSDLTIVDDYKIIHPSCKGSIVFAYFYPQLKSICTQRHPFSVIKIFSVKVSEGALIDILKVVSRHNLCCCFFHCTNIIPT